MYLAGQHARRGGGWLERSCWSRPCGSGLVSRKGRRAAPAIFAAKLKSWGRCAPLSRHKAAPTEVRDC
ncbi:hypothetical protein CMV24_15080 [Pseudomonas plecoglossicida]|uniref:Uncharacterized protein n=1 Tax=Pseudomonas plecoglossicida TaxID=70775 RepID=A0A2A3M3M3_PSEDL|nr:hypothetical protein CMV24_15080 [Pseudomonas plecoglossicida]